ncbi:hypothetical protein BU16DRAFT_27762 [Lophium mytilinum]|uniref:Uncharacterized protein n=1 Tax=Lophium mytilinum TaxID=390894 RepID=A0A6A6RHW3_9PEZI|nr:hypothetical protein BU16DRAFT_27762 [Lophium mytilinum]
MVVRRSTRPTKAPERLVDLKVTKPKHRISKTFRIRRINGQPPALSPLERLPAEILQEITVLSNNHFLPQASSLVGSKLSCEHIYMHFCFQGFFYYHDNAPSPIHQRWLFSRRWMTWSLFQNYAIKAYEEYHRRVYDGGTQCGYPISRFRPEVCFIKREWNRFGRPELRPPNFSPSNEDTDTFHPYLNAIHCRIPPKLLHGPFTADKLAFLRFLTTNPVMVRHTMDRKGYVFSSAWQEGLTLGNYDLLSLLLSHRLKRAVRPSGADLMNAVETYNSSRLILKLLIEKMVQRRAYVFSDPTLTDCVRRASDKDGLNRSWLLSWIQRAQDWQYEADLAYPRRQTMFHQMMQIRYLDIFTLDNTHLNDLEVGKEQLEEEGTRVRLSEANQAFL